MIALWSRALRNPGTCRCISCRANPRSMARSTGPIGLGGAWAFGTPTSTFVYTAVFAAGLAIDARAKHNRNKQWNSALDSLREEVRMLHTSPRRKTTPSSHEEDDALSRYPTPSDLDWDIVSDAIGMEMEDNAVFEERQKTSALDAPPVLPEVLWDLLRPENPFGEPSLLEWPASTGPGPGFRYNLPPQSLWALEIPRLKAMRNRQFKKKQDIQEVSICLLIHNLLRNSKATLASPDELASLSPHIRTVAHLSEHESKRFVHKILANIKLLETTQEEDWPEDTMSIRMGPKFPAEPDYHQDSDGDFHHIAKQLNVAIKKIFDAYHDRRKYPEDMALATAKICHNLLISSAAPNLETFNLLLIGFQKWQQPQLVDSVIKALDDCKIRPNEITCVAILDQFTDTGRPDAFSRFVAKMRGAGGALTLARPDIAINEKSEGRLIRLSETKVYQKVYPTPMVFNALMRGVLEFAGFQRAMDIYYEMKDDGWGLDMVGLSRFLGDCLNRADWDGGLLIWGEIASIQGRIKPDLLAKAYVQFLSLCSIVQKPAAFNKVLSDVVNRGFDRKAIVTEFQHLTAKVRKAKGYLAPAFTADNLLIAVSDYMKNGEAAEAETSPFFEEMNAGPAAENTEPQDTDTVDDGDAWTAWVTHELGGSPPNETTPPSNEGKVQTKPQEPDAAKQDDAWAAWMEHELGEPSPRKTSPSEKDESETKSGKDR